MTPPLPLPPGRERARQLLFPGAPFRMQPRIDRALADPDLQRFVPATTLLKDHAREAALAAAFGPRVDELRRLAGAIKDHTLAHLDQYLAQLFAVADVNGVHIHLAPDAEAARSAILAIATRIGAKTAVKAKSMVTEEIQLLDALVAAGIETWETDLGELVLQLDDDAPSHIVTPMIHKDRTAAGRAFARRLGLPETSDPETLTRYARAHLREAFLAADLGITGANFLVAATGEIVLCTNEGNGRLSSAAPPVHVAVAGIEKLVPTLEHLGVFLELLAKSSTGQPLTVYTSFVARTRQADESDGESDGESGGLRDREIAGNLAPGSDADPSRAFAKEIHLILLDAGRSSILADPTFREALRCIRCGACLNTCPVYRVIGGHAYGSVYPGPIGAVLTPLLRGPAATPDLPWASTLCGACRPACPVDIDLPGLLVAHRARAVRTDRHQRKLPRLLAFVMGGRRRWRVAGKVLARQRAPGAKSGWDVAGRRQMQPADSRPFHARWKLLAPSLTKRGGSR